MITNKPNRQNVRKLKFGRGLYKPYGQQGGTGPAPGVGKITGSVDTDTVSDGTLYTLADSSAADPPAGTVKANAQATQAVSGVTTQNVTINATLPNGTYYLHYVQETTGGFSNVITSPPFSVPDPGPGPGPVDPDYPSWNIPAYLGFDHITVPTITMGPIEIVITTMKIPFRVMASAANVTTPGATRDNGVGAVHPYTMLEHSWLLTYADDSPVTLDPADELTNARGAIDNPYTDWIGGEYAVPIREAGDYKLTLTSRGPDGGGGFTTNTAFVLLTAEEADYRHEWYDGAAGNNANDSFDPWGFALTAGVYTESTGVLVQAGAFSSYDHAAATAGNPTDWYNYIYLASDNTGATGTWHRIIASDENNQVTLSPKVGSDRTAVTSSNGAKETFIGAARKDQANGTQGDPILDRHNTFVHLRGNQGVTSYTFTEPFSFALGRNLPTDGWGDVYKIIGGYDSVVGSPVTVIGGAALDNDDEYLNKMVSTHVNSQGNIARFSSFHNLELHGSLQARSGFGGSSQEGLQEDAIMYLIDRIFAHDAIGQQASYQAATSAGAISQVLLWKLDINNHRNGFTYDTGVHDGPNGSTNVIDSSKSWTVNEWSDDVRTMLVTQAGNICQGRIDSNTSDTLAISASSNDGGFQYPDGSAAVINTGDTYVIAHPKSHAMYCNTEHDDASRMAIVGGQWTTASDRRVRDHYLYPSGKNHRLFAYNYFYDGSGSGPSYTFNSNYGEGPGDVANYSTVIENFTDGGCIWFLDGSGANNDPTAQGTFENVMVSRNAFNTEDGGIFTACMTQCVALDNIQFGDTGFSTRTFYGMFHGTGADVWDFAATDYVISRNQVFGEQSRIDDSSNLTNNASAEIVDNIIQQDGTGISMLLTNFNFLANRVYKDNNFYGPNDTDGVMFTNFAGSNETLAQFNVTVGETNIAVGPGWTDPANGDFT